MNQKFWDKLPPDIQKTIDRIMMEVTAEERKKAIELDKEQGALIREYAKKSGKLEIFELTPAQTKELQKAMKPVHDQFADVVPSKWVEQVKKMK